MRKIVVPCSGIIWQELKNIGIIWQSQRAMNSGLHKRHKGLLIDISVLYNRYIIKVNNSAF